MTQKAASLIIGSNTRFDTKPGESFTSTGVFPNALAIATVRAAVGSEVSTPRITSTRCITGTGFMKCVPITWAARLVCAAIVVIELDEVLVARIAPGGAGATSECKSAILISSFTDGAA